MALFYSIPSAIVAGFYFDAMKFRKEKAVAALRVATAVFLILAVLSFNI